ncbi:hypothetical protein AOL_s00173g32 [Orbilia oligospora ATCC 24927]|uniref:SET domain-containing protein n=1 Tax=Arthrobotrys oligospora (strain ATCC 24927 / CBS 115.81 / DSM 1491) TaxID=756982 RepID=G1XNL4_ARTOA|nr:hypothetical protein AOL_s00173g32 [Orbilia oligospora ATCC 24927]EGX44931.1 hypothetical protein AOL_s00173g32 [Orbilia oligospora ATCC 24927]
MAQSMAPAYTDPARTQILTDLATTFEKLYESSAPNQGKKNTLTTKEAVMEKYKHVHEQETKYYSSEGALRFVLTDPYEPANPCFPIEKLRKIQVRDLIVGKHHKSAYIKIKLVSIAQRHECAVDVMFEDEGGTYGALRVYFLEEETDPWDHLPKGNLLIIRDPYFWDSGDGAMFVRVDHHSDMQFIHSWDTATEKHVPAIWKHSVPLEEMTASQLVGLAELFHEDGEFQAALEKYNWAEQRIIKKIGPGACQDVLRRLYIGRADTNVKLRRHYATVKDIEAYLKLSPDDPEALHLRALRYYYTGKYELCQEEVGKLLEKHPKQITYLHLGRRAKERYEEVKFGKYNWKAMRQKAAKLEYNLDHAEFSHPVKLKKTPNGRRIFTTRDIKRGDILMVSKAIAITGFEDANACIQIAPRNGKFECEYGCSAAFDIEILERIKREGSEWYEKTLCLMDEGGYFPAPHRYPDGTKAVDTFHIEAIRRKNSMIISNLPLLQHRSTGYMVHTPSHIPRNIHYNCGMWFLPSFLRHSCIPNAHRSAIGEMLIVRAGKDIPKDTKVTINCSTPSNWEFPMTEFVCTCPVHTHDFILSGDPNDPENVTKLKASIWREFNNKCQYIEKAKTNPEKWMKINLLELLSSMSDCLDKARPSIPSPNEIPQVQLAHRHRYIAAAYYGAGQRRHARCACYKVLDSLGVGYIVLEQFDRVVWKNHGQCTDDLLHTYNDLSAMAKTPGMKKCWRDAAIDTYEILCGERYSFDAVMPKVPFVELQDKCQCVGIDNLMDATEAQMRKRMGVDPKKEEEVRSTVDGLAIMQIMNDGAARAWKNMQERKKKEQVIGAEAMAEIIMKREKDREVIKKREEAEAEAEEKRLKREKENEKSAGPMRKK